MANGRTHKMHFRIYKPERTQASSRFAPDDYMFYLPQDYNDGGKPNIYYFLPADKRVDTESIQTMIGHEASHAALDHNDKDLLTPEQRATYQKACGILRKSALETVGTPSRAASGLRDLRRAAPAELKPAYTTVIAALEEGKYDELPTRAHSPSEVSECYVQNPIQAVRKQTKLLGVSELSDTFSKSKEVADLEATLKDEWNDALEKYTVYKHLKEATWLLPGESNEGKGHPQDGVHEVAASSLNRLLQDPEQFGKDIATIKVDDRKAITDLLDLATTMLREKYPDAHDLHQVIGERRTVFNRALGK